ncbi:hypothetical protein ACJROX_07280 [Pseudalkalibacillus sp. A8]|uniref:hypothetical protein n=1 Tax=Pseudalkalibacillus sp. A8 TaxID=3382641 RepID=UPI0038B43675
MSNIGFELVANMALPVLPGHAYSIWVMWNGRRLSSSIGKDAYHRDGLILPDRRITATGRIDHQSANTSSFGDLQASECRLVPCPSFQPKTILVQLILPKGVSLSPIDRFVRLHFIIEETSQRKKIPLYLDHQSVQELSPEQLQFDLSLLLPKHLDQTNNGVKK